MDATMALRIATTVILLLISAQPGDLCGGGLDSGDSLLGYTDLLKYEEELDGSTKELAEKIAECDTCISEVKRKVEQGLRCDYANCDFEAGTLCKYRTGGKPGVDDELLDKFLSQNPSFNAAEERRRRARVRALLSRRRTVVRNRRQAEEAAAAGVEAGKEAVGEQVPDAPDGLPELPEAPDALDPWKPPPEPKLSEAELDEAAKAIIEDMHESGKIPKPEDLPPVESDKTWGVYRGQFGKSTIDQAGQSEFYATAYVYPDEVAVMQSDVDMSGDEFRVTFKYWKAAQDVNLKFCCDDTTRCTAETGYLEGSAKWRSLVAHCPEGTQRMIFVCENIGYEEGACGVDDIKLHTSDGVDYCEHAVSLQGEAQPTGNRPQPQPYEPELPPGLDERARRPVSETLPEQWNNDWMQNLQAKLAEKNDPLAMAQKVAAG